MEVVLCCVEAPELVDNEDEVAEDDVVLCCVEALELIVDNEDEVAEYDVLGDDKVEDKVEGLVAEVLDGVLLVDCTKSQQGIRANPEGNIPPAGSKWIST